MVHPICQELLYDCEAAGFLSHEIHLPTEAAQVFFKNFDHQFSHEV